MTPRTLITAFAATLVAVAVGAPAASAAVLVSPLDISEDNGAVTMRLADTEGIGGAVLIDGNNDGRADQMLRFWPTDAPYPPFLNLAGYASLSALALSTTTCQEELQGPQGLGGAAVVMSSLWP